MTTCSSVKKRTGRKAKRVRMDFLGERRPGKRGAERRRRVRSARECAEAKTRCGAKEECAEAKTRCGAKGEGARQRGRGSKRIGWLAGGAPGARGEAGWYAGAHGDV